MKPKTAKEYKLVAIDSKEQFERKKMTTSQDCANYIRQFFDSDIGLKLFCINLLDHVILTEDSYYSFLDEGLL